MTSVDVTVHVRGLRLGAVPPLLRRVPRPGCGWCGRSPGGPAVGAGERGKALTTTREHDNIDTESETEEFEPLAARADVREDSPLFADLGADERIVQALSDVGITRTFAIQEMTLPIALAGSDLIGQARTGTGKTLGFGVPLLQRIELRRLGAAGAGRRPDPRAVRPGRPRPAGRRRAPRRAGDRDLRRPRLRAADRARCARASTWSSAPPAGCSTWPTRATCSSARSPDLVLDEADEMLDLGFLPDIERILARWCRTSGRPCCSRRPCRARSSRWPGGSCASRCTSGPSGNEESRPVAADPAVRLPGPRDGQGGDAGPDAAGQRPRPDDDLLPDQADRAEGRRRPGRPRLRGRRRARRPRPGRPRAGAAGVPRRARSTCWWRPTSPPAASTSRTSRTSSTTSAPRTRRPTCTGSAAPAGPARPGSRSPSSTGTTCPRWKLINDALGLPLHAPAETYSTSEHLFVDLDIPEGATGRLPRAAADPGRAGGRGGRGPRRDRRARRLAAAVPVPVGVGLGPHPASIRASIRASLRAGLRAGRGHVREPAAAVPGPAAHPRRPAGRRVGGRGRCPARRARPRARPSWPARSRPWRRTGRAAPVLGPGSGTGSGEGQRRRRRRRGGRGRGAATETSDASVAESA